MNEVIDTILNRRSVRNYKDEQIDDNDLNIVLDCARYAPSGMNRQSYAFVAIQNQDIMNEIIDACMKILNINTSPFYGAPTIVLVFGDKNSPTYIEDACAGIENMTIAATSLNLGSCWIRCAKDLFESEYGESIREKIEVPENYMCIGSLVLGYVNGEYPEAKQRKENIIKIIK